MKEIGSDFRIWLGDERAIETSAIAAPLVMTLSIAILVVAVKLQMSAMVTVAWIVAAASLASHVWFALLRTRLVVALYQYLFVRWGNARLEAIGPIRRRARALAIGAAGSWTVAVMQGLTLFSLGLAYTYPEVIPVYAVVLALSCAYSTGFIYARKALLAEVSRLSDVAPVCEAHL